MIRDYSNPMPDFFDTPDEGPAFYDLEFTFVRPPLMANKQMHWAARMRIVKDVRNQTEVLARRIPFLGRCHVTLTWFVNDRRRRDGNENITDTLKPMIDGLVDAGVISDDTPNLVIRDMPVIRYEKDTTPRLVLRVARILPEAKAAA